MKFLDFRTFGSRIWIDNVREIAQIQCVKTWKTVEGQYIYLKSGQYTNEKTGEIFENAI